MPKSTSDISWKERKQRLANNISADRFTMLTKCFHYTSANVPCVMDLRTGRYAECARHGQSCNSQVTRIEYEKIRKSREKIAAQLEAAEEEEDELTRKLLKHRSREAEASSIAEAERLEEELLAASLEPISADLTSFDPYPIDSRLLLLPEQWSNLKGVLFPVLGFTSDDSGPGTPQLASATQNVH
ncbi:hypothetical protein Q7P35_006824 [Cladosporium inversicolor]